jgi:hypothetical protein
MKYHKSTNLGIEIEICVEKEKYKSLKSTRKNQETVYKYPKGEDPFRPGYESNSGSNKNNSNSNKSEELRDILLTKDPTCKCTNRQTHTPAEIVSPRMSPDELPIFYSFLEEQLMEDMSKIEQAKTCGIHVHWSNRDLQLYPDDYNYLFEFIRILFHLRKYFNTKVVDAGFSGRLHHYDDIIQKPIIITPKTPQVKNKIFICKVLKINLDNNITLNDIEEQVLDTDLKVYQWRESYNFKRIYKLFFYLHEEKLDIFLILFFVIAISNQESFLTKEMGFIKNDYKYSADITSENLIYYLDFTNEKMKELYIIDNLIKLLREVEKIYENPKDRFGSWALEGLKHMRTDLKEIVNKEFHGNLENTQDLMKHFYTLMSEKKTSSMKSRAIKYLPSELRDILFFEEKEKLSKYSENITHKYIIENIISNLFKSGMSFYDLKDFHMEMRIFALDDLFRRDKKVTAQKIVSEIDSFVEKTEHFFVSIIDRLNKMYDPKKKEIPESKKELYDEFFLMDKTYKPRNRAVTEKLRELFGIEQMGSVKSRSVKSRAKPSLQRSPKGKGKGRRTKTSRRNSNLLSNLLSN